MKKLLFLIIILSGCTAPRIYNYQIVDRANHLTQAADSVTKHDVYRMIDFTMIQSDFDFEIKVSKTKSFLNEITSKQH